MLTDKRTTGKELGSYGPLNMLELSFEIYLKIKYPPNVFDSLKNIFRMIFGENEDEEENYKEHQDYFDKEYNFIK